MSSTGRFLNLRVSVSGCDPEIWRLLDVDAGISLAEFHDVLQIAFGWRDSHLHSFTDHSPFAPHHELPESAWALSQVFDGFDGPLFYAYDFGDEWIHVIELVERIDRGQRAPKAVLVDGARRGPLEDSGGIAGYAEKLAVLADPQHPEHDGVAEWVRRVAGARLPYDPNFLDIDGVNADLAARFEGKY